MKSPCDYLSIVLIEFIENICQGCFVIFLTPGTLSDIPLTGCSYFTADIVTGRMVINEHHLKPPPATSPQFKKKNPAGEDRHTKKKIPQTRAYQTGNLDRA